MGNKIQKYKLERVDRLKKKIQETDKFIFVDYRGLTVEQITELRNELRKIHAELHVVKNSATKVAFKQLDEARADGFLINPTALACCHDEPGPVAKAMFGSAKTTTLSVKGALLGGEMYDSAGLEALSKLPGRSELIQMLMGAMQAPVSSLVYALNGVSSQLVRTLAAVCEKKAGEA